MRFCCRLGVHCWERVGQRFAFCTRPGCTRVEHRAEEGYWDLDICNTDYRYVWTRVQ